ncbi:unnamed protein product, partial [Phyllotreta striolata]
HFDRNCKIFNYTNGNIEIFFIGHTNNSSINLYTYYYNTMKNSHPSQIIVHPDRLSSSVISLVCRICYDTEKDEDLITPCNCKVITGNGRVRTSIVLGNVAGRIEHHHLRAMPSSLQHRTHP